MTGKNFCKVESKWCKFCNHKKICKYDNKPIKEIHKYPKREANETVSFRHILKNIDLEKTLSILFKYWPEQEKNKEGYIKVYRKLLTLKGVKSNMFIYIGKTKDYNEGEYLYCSGLVKNNNISYAIEFVPWEEWLTMNIDQESLDSLSYEEIAAGALYEMTWAGFTQERIKTHYNEIINASNKYVK